jgi:hypothetical protein
MVKIYNKETGEFLGRISKDDIEFLARELEEEGLQDRDYYIRRETLDSFPSKGASPHLLEVLRGGLRNLDTIEIRWESDQSDKAE